MYTDTDCVPGICQDCVLITKKLADIITENENDVYGYWLRSSDMSGFLLITKKLAKIINEIDVYGYWLRSSDVSGFL